MTMTGPPGNATALSCQATATSRPARRSCWAWRSAGLVSALGSCRARRRAPCVPDEDEAREHHRQRQQHAHSQAAPQEAELRIRLAEELAEGARQAVEQREGADDQPRPLEGAGANEHS